MARPKRPPKSPPAAPPTPTASPPAPPDDGPSYPQTHTFAYRPGSEAMSCACGAEQDLRLVDGKATRFYRMAGGSWGRSIATCPKYVPPAPPAPPPPPSPHAERMSARIAEVVLTRIVASWRDFEEAYEPGPAEGLTVGRLVAAGRVEAYQNGYRPTPPAA